MEPKTDRAKHNDGAQVRSESWLDALTKNVRAEADLLRKYHQRAGGAENHAAANVVEAIAKALERTLEGASNNQAQVSR